MVRRFEDHAHRYDVRNSFPDYIIAKHTDIDIECLRAKMNEIMFALFSGTLDNETSTMAKQQEIAQLVTPEKNR